MKRIYALLGLVLCLITPAFAADVGLLLNQTLGYEGYETDGAVDYSGTISPWFSSSLGKNAGFYLSAAFTLKYEGFEDGWNGGVPELLRTELNLRFREAVTLKLGRIYYADPLALVAEGLFDGVRTDIDAGGGAVSLGLYYTGFLYKKNINIHLTDEEVVEYDTPFDYGDFADTYFAPRRAVVSLGWSNPGLAGDLLRLNLDLLGQLDCSGGEDTYHSQYLIARAGIPFKDRFFFEAGAAVELIEAASDPVRAGLALDLLFAYTPPTPIQDRLTLGGRWASGAMGDTVVAFTPITTESQGHILQAGFSGLTSVTAAYTARVHSAFSLVLDASYFIRNDTETYTAWPVSNTGNLLGGEAYAQFIWNPLSDLRLTLGGGAFFPALGNTGSEAKPVWKVQLDMVVALY
jgi:hypothetical protein